MYDSSIMLMELVPCHNSFATISTAQKFPVPGTCLRALMKRMYPFTLRVPRLVIYKLQIDERLDEL